MLTKSPPQLVKVLAHDLRWQLVQALVMSDYRVGELVAQVDQPLNLVSYHLKQLRTAQLVTTRRSEADGRDTYYSLDLDHLNAAYSALGAALHPSLATTATIQTSAHAPQPATPSQTVSVPRVLFVCTHNSARSQMAEGLLRCHGAGKVEAYSAGSHPTRIHPDAIATMDTFGIDIRGHHVTHTSDLAGESFDAVITVCDQAREVCPRFPGGGMNIHWGFADPSRITDPDERRDTFMQTALRLQSRIEHFLTQLNTGDYHHDE